MDDRHDHWGVTVFTGFDTIVTIETECLSGRELSIADEEAIRTAARHLWSFVGDGQPYDSILVQDLRARLEAVERERDALQKAANQWHDSWSRAYDRAERAEAEVARLTAAAETARREALTVIEECRDEIDRYILQEYPYDHPVHERYRKRDFSANPARIYLEQQRALAAPEGT